MYCTKCGTQHDANFCPSCGTPAHAGPFTPSSSPPLSSPPRVPPQAPTKKPKKPIYKRTWFWVAVGVVLFIGLIQSIGKGDKNTDASPTATGATAGLTASPLSSAKLTQTPRLSTAPVTTPVPTTAAIKMPGIGGSQAYDVILSLEQKGVAQPDTQTILNGFSWSSGVSDIDGVQFQYDIIANENHEIAAASFIVLGKDDIGILAFCASLPYAAANTDAAIAFVDEHLDEDATITIGDAIFAIMQIDGGVRLDVTVVGFDDYMFSVDG